MLELCLHLKEAASFQSVDQQWKYEYEYQYESIYSGFEREKGKRHRFLILPAPFSSIGMTQNLAFMKKARSTLIQITLKSTETFHFS